MDIKLGTKVFVGTFHKTGTVLMRSIFREICTDFGLQFWNAKAIRDREGEWDVYFDRQSRFLSDAVLFTDDARAVVVIRDPRDIVISAAYYHCKSDEAWLHRPQEEFGSITYHEKINSLNSDADKFLFEMDHSARKVIGKMSEVLLAADPRVYVTRFEDLVVDVECHEFRKIFTFLGFPESLIPDLIRIASSKSLFSGGARNAQHVRSGKPQQWREKFSDDLCIAFEERFPSIVKRFGYPLSVRTDCTEKVIG